MTAFSRAGRVRIASRMALIDRQAERFRVLNGLEPGERLKTGEQVKIIVE